VFTKNQITEMLELQNQMNNKVNPYWLTANNDWMLAAMMESVEAIDHHGWKWWKKQTPDMPQLQMELVDVWHFILSEVLVTTSETDDAFDVLQAEASSLLFNNSIYKFTFNDLVTNLKLMSGLMAFDKFNIPLFMFILKQADMTTDDLYKQYIGKNVLNFFRQKNGYKEGTYIKIWDDENNEDNFYLVRILNNLDAKSETFSKEIYENLSVIYSGL